MRLIDRLNRPPVYLPAVMALVMVTTVVVVVQAAPGIPNPRLLSQYDVRTCTAADLDDCDPALATPPGGTTVTEHTGLQLGLVHHLDVDDDGTGSANCGGWHELGEVAGRCNDQADITTQVSIDSSIVETAPVARINRAPAAIIENRDAPPTRVDITYTVTDTAGLLPDIQITFGYLTPPGGSIPDKFTGYVLGLLPPPDADASWTPFNPMTLVVDSGQFTTLSGVAPVAPTYGGPLTVTGGFAMPAHDGEEALDLDLELAYTPLPERIAVEWERDEATGHHITYGHDAPGTHVHEGDPACNPADDPPVAGCPRDVDLDARIRSTTGDDPDPDLNEYLQVDARIDRLPNMMSVDVEMLTEEGRRNQGVVDFTVPTSAILPSGRLPDARFDILTRVPNDGDDAATFPIDVQAVTAHVEQMPTQLHAEWYLPEKQEIDGQPGCAAVTDDLPPDVVDPCLARAEFEVPAAQLTGPFVGGVELDVRNHEGQSDVLDPFLPGWDQYLNLQSTPVEPGSTRLHERLTARVERIREVVFEETATGFTTHTELGDGAAPLQVHVGTDERTVEDPDRPGVFGTKMDADLLVAPLPDELDLTVQTPDEAEDRPLVVDWDASASVAPSIDVDGTLELRGAPAADGAACGEPHTLCADLDLDHIPDVGVLTVDQDDDETLIALDTSPSADEALDLVADLTMRPCTSSAPIVAQLDLRRVPEHLRARALTPVVSGDPEVDEGVCAIEEEDVPPPPDAPVRGLSRFELQPCAYDFAARACAADTEGAFGAITLAARNFLERPDEIPHVPITTTPVYASAAVRDAGVSVDTEPTDDDLFEIEARLLEVRELQFLQHEGTIGARMKAGRDADEDGAGDDPFMVAFDIDDVLLDPDDPEATRQDLSGHALLTPLPTDVDLCFRSPGGELVGEAFDPITAVCEDAQPFGPDVPLSVAPTSFALDTSAEFRLDALLERVDRGTATAVDPDRSDDQTIRVELGVEPVPSDGIGGQPDLVVHVQTPEEDSTGGGDDPSAESDTAVRMQFDAVAPSSPIMVDFDAQILDAELFCTDPRLPDEIEPDPETGERRFQSALCMSGRIENLPTHVLTIYDPETEGQNFRFEHDGAEVNLVDLLLTSVSAAVDEGFDGELDTEDDEVVPAILVAEGELHGLPPLMKGTIVPPGTVVLRSVDPTTEDPDDPAADQDGAPVDQISVVARNFIAPDPMPDAPPQRVIDGVALPEADHDVQVFRRDELFKAIVEVGDLVKAGFETQRDVDGNFLDTSILSVDFGQPDDVVRGYADLQMPTERDDPETPDVDEARDSLIAVIGDVTLQDKPAGVTVCFRGEREFTAPPVNPVYCDTEPEPDAGAIQVRMRPYDEEGTARRLDVDAFLRLASAGGGDVLAATTHVDNLPRVVQGTFSDRGADFEGVDLEGAPQGIDALSLELANFDLADEVVGYGEDRPWTDNIEGPGWTPADGEADGATTFSREPISDYFARLRSRNEQLFVQAAFGVIDGPGTPDSNIQRVSFADTPCPADDPVPDHHPHFPDDLNSSYTCVRGFFEEHEGGADDPLDLELVIEEDGELLSLNGVQPADDNRLARAGLSRLPHAFAATLAETVTLDPDTALRDPCGTHLDHEPDDVSCMPPMLRMDIDPNGPFPSFFGVLELGRTSDLMALREESPRASIAGADGAGTLLGDGLAEAPGPDGFDDWPDGHGIRGRIKSFEPQGELDDGTAVIVGLHLPLEGSLTFDQLQKWSCVNGEADCPGTDAQPGPLGQDEPAENSDLRVRYVARDTLGDVLSTIGQLALMIVDEEGGQILLADPDAPTTDGVSLPGELGLQMFKRDRWDSASDDKQFERSFLQLDGRASSTIELGARIFGDEVRETHAKVRGTDTIADGDTDPLNPSFRLRAGIDKNTPTEDEEDCLIYVVFNFCKIANINQIGVDIDYLDAQRVDAYVAVDKPENAVEVRGYDVLHGTDAADESPINLDVLADLDITIVLVIPIILQVVAALDIDATMDVDSAEQFRWRNNLLRMQVAHDGSSGGADVDIDIIPTILYGLLLIPIPFFTIVWGFAYVWPPTVGPEMLVTYKSCNTFTDISFGGFSVDAGDSTDVYADITQDPRLIEFGTASIGQWLLSFISFTGIVVGPGAGLLGIVSWFVSCAAPGASDLDLIADGVTVGPPTAPTAHPVPGFGTTTVDNPPAPTEPEPEDLEVSEAVALCGTHVYRRITVLSGGRIDVATGSDCPDAEASGELVLIANEIEVADGGAIDATDATGLTQLNAENVTIASGGSVTGGVAPISFNVVDRLQVDGTVIADEVRTSTTFDGSTAPTGNGGAGHGGDGGDGSDGTGGDSYGDTSFDPDPDTGLAPMEPGSRGGATDGTPGDGGGQLQLSASIVRISGVVSANGGDASADPADAGAQCAVPDDPDTEDVDESEANTGLAGPGGGSGGTVVVRGQLVDVSGGTLAAVGGDGAAGHGGGGGGGAGGHVKVAAPIYSGPDPDRDGGDGGATLCADDHDAGAGGADGPVIEDRSPSSRVAPVEGMFFHRGVELDLPIRAAARQDVSDGFQVVLCGLHRPPEAAVAEDEDDAEQDFGIDQPSAGSQSVANPCGTATGDTTVHVIGHADFPDTDLTDDDAVIRATDDGSSVDITGQSGNGFWGMFTVVGKPSNDDNDCFDQGDFSIFGSGALYDQLDCTYEAIPEQADTIVGIDNDPPDIGSAAIVTNGEGRVFSETVQVSIGDVTDDMPFSSGSDVVENQSGLRRVECRNSGDTDWERCGVGTFEWDLAPGADGERTLEVRAIDLAGNISDVATSTVTLDITAPTFSASLVGGTLGLNGWYVEPPDVRLEDFDDSGGSGPGDPVTYEYWFNGGTHRNCLLSEMDSSDPVCEVTSGVPSLGIHRLQAVAVDLAGHRSDAAELPFRSDGLRPQATLLTAPFEPDAANDWFGLQPFAVISAVDQPFGAGLEPLDETDTTTGVFYAVDEVLDGAPSIPVGDFTRSDAIFQLSPGAHEVCYYAVDQAGNPTAGAIGAPEPTCEEVLVDDELPTATLTPDPVDGDNGWYVSEPTVVVTGDDASSGVGDTGQQCDPLATPSGICLSQDRMAWEDDPSGTSRTFTTDGVHSLRAFSTDVAGKRSGLATLDVPVDLTDPLTTVRTQPPAPTRNGRFRVSPEVHLSAQEPHLHNSGVDHVEWCLEDTRTGATECGGPADFTVYDGPFLVPDGDWELQFRATDRAGREETLRTEPLFVDTTPPTADATIPVPTPPDPYHNLVDDAELHWTAFDELSDEAEVSVLIYGWLPAVGVEMLRRIEDGTIDPSPQHDGSTTWDGQRELVVGGIQTLVPVPPRAGVDICLPLIDPGCDLGPLPLSGRYWYRIVVTDEAGNVTQTDQSMYVEVKLL